MKKFMIGCGIILVLIIIIAIGMFSYGVKQYNQIVKLEQNVEEKWSQVENVYQRRYDLIPNLVSTVKGYASHEKETFQAVTEARAKAGGVMNISESVINNPEAFAKFQQVQSGLGDALKRLMVIQERYPELKANQNFMSLQDQLEGTENRIAVERKRFNESAKAYNVFIKQFPRMMIANMLGFKEKMYFKSQNEAQTAPKVEF